jgi:hypothetical protein
MSDQSPIPEQGKDDPDKIVQSPCVRNCCLDENDICLGCFRSLKEITRWSAADSRERNTILQQAHNRKDLYQRRQSRTNNN